MPLDGPSLVLWWVPAGHLPTLSEAIDRLEYLRRQGPSAAAFTFRQPFDAPLAEGLAKLKTAAGAPLQVRVGIATGIVVVGDLIEAETTQEHEVVGETPNLAARLQALAEPGAVVVAASTRRLVSAPRGGAQPVSRARAALATAKPLHVDQGKGSMPASSSVSIRRL